MEINVNLGSRSYPILVDTECKLKLPETLRNKYPSSRFAIITNETLAKIYDSYLSYWRQSLDAIVHIMPDGEQYKTIDTWSAILDTLLAAKLDRKSVVIAFGGGVVGDVAGFAAAAFLRGVDYVQIPTTLLAMVDSSVGGKTAVDHPKGKNLIGAFHQPRLVWIDQTFLDTLSDREFMAGYAEMFKCAFIGGIDMFNFIAQYHPAIIAKDKNALNEGIIRSVKIKAHVVEQDEHETSGLRALLNFGHTFAHSLEKYFSFHGILHGEAVWWGIKCAYDLSKRASLLSENSIPIMDDLISRIHLPQIPSRPTEGDLYDAMFSDKKTIGGSIRFVVPIAPGESIVKKDIPERLVRETLRAIFTYR